MYNIIQMRINEYLLQINCFYSLYMTSLVLYYCLKDLFLPDYQEITIGRVFHSFSAF